MELFASARPNLPRVKNYKPGKPLEELEREYGIHNAIKMASNENALGPSPKAVQAIRKNLSKIHRYPDGGCFYLRNKLSKMLGVSTDSLVFGNGSDEMLVLAVRAFVDPQDEVIIADPTFLIYEIAVEAQGGKTIKVPMKNFRYDLAGMKQRISQRTKIIFIANPDNPVGTYVDEKSLVGFLKDVPRRVVVVLDEAYYEFAKVKKDYPHSLKLLESFENLLITRTFSKAYGLGGLRIGFGITRAPIANALNKVREPFNVNLLAQVGAVAALDDKAHLSKTIKMVAEGRRYLTRELRRLSLRTVDTVTNFILVDLQTDAQALYEKLLRKGVIVRGMGAWGLKSFIRVTIGKKAENVRFIKALKESLHN